jgi:cell division protein ZapA
MSHVSVTISGRQYRMACEDGQEGHLMKLAAELDKRIGDLRERFGEIGDMRLTVMAAIMVADELSEIGKRASRLEGELAGLQDARAAAADRAQQMQAALATALNAASERIEQVTRNLNEGLGSDGVAIG